MRIKSRYRLLVLMLFLLCGTVATADIVLTRNVLGGGGGDATGSHLLRLTVGQSCIGVLSGSEFVQEIGFWYQYEAIVTDLDEISPDLPSCFNLGQNYPNPFNPVTTIGFTMPKASQVIIRLFDVNGRLVMKLFDGSLEPGYHNLVLDASDLASGIFFYRMEATGFIETKKMIVLK